jgi:hypothetical protein
MLRTTSIVLWSLLPMPALAAGGLEDDLFNCLVVLIVGAVPAAGVGYVLGSFLRLLASILVLVVLAFVPIALFWILRGLPQAANFTTTPVVMLLMFSPLLFIGWRFGRRDAIRHFARKSSLQNGH